MPPAVRLVDPVDPRRADGAVAAVYRQVRSELGVLGPALTLYSPAPELLAAVWSLLRESLLVGGPEERTAKEVVATVIAVRNDCRFCVDAHATMLHALGEGALAEGLRTRRPPREWAALADWAAEPAAEGPFPAAAAPRFIGTALVFELITRLVKVFAPNESPSPVLSTKLGRSVGSRLVRELVAADLEPGASLPLLDERPDWAEAMTVRVPLWAGDSPVGTAYGTLRARAGYGAMLLSDPALEAVARTVGVYGTEVGDRVPPLAGAERLPGEAGSGARLAVAAAIAPASVSAADAAAWRGEVFTDHQLVHLMTFGAMNAVDAVQDEIETRNVDA